MNTEIRTTLNLPAELAELVDDYWHTQRLSSRNEAIRALLIHALNDWFRTNRAKVAKETRK